MKNTLIVVASNIHGKGLFATEQIPKDTIIGYCQTKQTKKPSDYTLWLESGPVDVTCCFKYINHDPHPNVAYYDDLSVVALKTIRAGHELTHHYGADWE